MNLTIYDWKKGTRDLMDAFYHVPASIRSNILLKGKSAEVLRRVAFSISDTLQEDTRIPFIGVMKSFALRVPAFSTQDGAVQALDSLMSSVECAAGYYSVYEGVIILEFDKEWSEVRNLANLSQYLNYIQVNRNHVCFIILLPGLNTSLEEFILRYATFHVVEVKEPSLEQLSSMFRAVAQEKGYTLSPAAESILTEKSQMILNAGGDYPIAIESLVEKAVFHHVANGKTDKSLKQEDLEHLHVPSGVAYDKPLRQIGFSRGE